MAIDALNASFYADPAALGALKRDAAAQSPEALRETAKQFESLFTTMLLKSMRAGLPGDPFGSDQQDFYQDMFDQQIATQLSRGKGLGLADMLVRQLMQGGEAVDAALGSSEQAASAMSPGLRSLSGTGSAGASATWRPGNAEEFVQAIRPAATAAARQLGVDPDAVIAHAALETGWGSALPGGSGGESSFNLFGIKATAGWQGAARQSSTREFIDGRMQERSAAFRAYESPEHSLRDYVELLSSNPRYATALNTGSDVGAFARGLARGGYATDPDYVTKLTAIVTRLKSAASAPITQAGSA